MHVWLVEHLNEEQSDNGYEGWSVGYAEDGNFLPVFSTYDETWAKTLVAAVELYEAAIDLPDYSRLPPVREVSPRRKRTRTRKVTE